MKSETMKALDLTQQNEAHRSGTLQAGALSGKDFTIGYLSGSIRSALSQIENGADLENILENVEATLKRADAYFQGYELAR